MNMVATAPIQNSKQSFECMRRGHQDNRRDETSPPIETFSFSDAEKAKRVRDKAAEALQMASLAETASRRETLLQIANHYNRTADQLESITDPDAKTRRRR
jgi:hypothetical protein